jgi:hypothetical protein
VSVTDKFLKRSVLTSAECERWVRGIYAARAAWTPCFHGVQFTLGRAYYTHLEEGAADEYFARATQSDAVVERAVPGLQDHVRALMAELLGEPVTPRVGWCGPGVHIFPAGGWLAQNGGDVHFDTEGLRHAELAARVPALSAILMLQSPPTGGGLRVWDALWDGDDSDAAIDRAARAPSTVVTYDRGDLVVIDSYRLHQIQPFDGAHDRVSVTEHLVFSEGRWQAWF